MLQPHCSAQKRMRWTDISFVLTACFPNPTLHEMLIISKDAPSHSSLQALNGQANITRLLVGHCLAHYTLPQVPC